MKNLDGTKALKSRYERFVDGLDSKALIHEFYLNVKTYGKAKMKLTEAQNLKYLMERIVKFVKDQSFVMKVRVSLEVLKRELATLSALDHSSSGSPILFGASGLPA